MNAKNLSDLGELVTSELSAFLSKNLVTAKAKGISEKYDEVVLATPFKYYNTEQVKIWIAQNEKGCLIHDNSIMYECLVDYGKERIFKRRKIKSSQEMLNRYDSLVQSYNLEFNPTRYRFQHRFQDEKNIGRETFEFINGLISLSFLAVQKI